MKKKLFTLKQSSAFVVILLFLFVTLISVTACAYETKNRDQIVEEIVDYLQAPAKTKSFSVLWQEGEVFYEAFVHKNEILLKKGMISSDGEVYPAWFEFWKEDFTACKDKQTGEKVLIYEHNTLNKDEFIEKYRQGATILYEILSSDVPRKYNFDKDYSTGQHSKWPLSPLQITFDREGLDAAGFSAYGNVVELGCQNNGDCSYVSLKWENEIICIKLSVEDDGISKKVEDDFSDYTVIE